jgi:hypothetical protein
MPPMPTDPAPRFPRSMLPRPIRSLVALLFCGYAAAAQPAIDDASAPASALSSPLPLFDGRDLSSWWIDPAGTPATIDQGELVIHNRIGSCFHAEVGGMSWDDYEVACEFQLLQDTSDASRQAGQGRGWNLQLCPHDTLIFAQLLGSSALKIAYVDIIGGRPFVNLSQGNAPVPAQQGEWHHLSVLASGGVVAMRIDGVATIAGVVPIGTKGMFGLLGNFGSDAQMRLRHLTIAFLRPTTRQLQEYARPALVNWQAWVESQHGAAEGVLDPKVPGKGLDPADKPAGATGVDTSKHGF